MDVVTFQTVNIQKNYLIKPSSESITSLNYLFNLTMRTIFGTIIKRVYYDKSYDC